MASEKSNKIVKMRRYPAINIGTVIFGVLFLYMIINLVLYFTTSHITIYEVTAGHLGTTNTYRAMAVREETVVTAGQAGYVNYYAREGEKVNAYSTVYSIDEGGRLSEALEASEGLTSQLSSKDINNLRVQMANYASSYSRDNFQTVYGFKNEMEGVLLDLVNANILENIASLTQADGSTSLFTMASATSDGVIVYNIDEYEGVTASECTAEMFDTDKYEKKNLRTNTLINAGDPVYKLITDENWSMVIMVDPQDAPNLETDYPVEIRFVQEDITTTAEVTLFENEGVQFARFDLNHSMVRYATDRFIDIELMLDTKEGLKIPNSAIAEKEFFLVPTDYLINGGNDSEAGFLREVYGEDGEVSSEFVAATIYDEQEDEYYVDMVTFHAGDTLIRTDSSQRFQVAKTDKIYGVYNINKGYAIFRQITILDQNEEYCIVAPQSNYGLAQYDHIVLDSSTVKEEDIVY